MPLETGTGASSSVEIASVSDSSIAVLIKSLEALDRLMAHQLEDQEKRLVIMIDGLRQEGRVANINSDRAVEVASKALKEQLDIHNGLLRKMDDKDRTYATENMVEGLRNLLGTRLDEIKSSFDTRLSIIERQIVSMPTRAEFTTQKESIDARSGRIEKFQYLITGALILISFLGRFDFSKLFQR